MIKYSIYAQDPSKVYFQGFCDFYTCSCVLAQQEVQKSQKPYRQTSRKCKWKGMKQTDLSADSRLVQRGAARRPHVYVESRLQDHLHDFPVKIRECNFAREIQIQNKIANTQEMTSCARNSNSRTCGRFCWPDEAACARRSLRRRPCTATAALGGTPTAGWQSRPFWMKTKGLTTCDSSNYYTWFNTGNETFER